MASKPIIAPCNRDFHASRVSGFRPLSAVKWVVLHETESEGRGDTTSDTARAVASYFQSPNAGGSAHLVVDNDDCYRCLLNEEIPWGAPGANTNGFHIEHCGNASWSRTIWRVKNGRMLSRGAYKAALFCVNNKIRIRYLNAADLIAGKDGVTVHFECTRAFGGDHTCPGPNFPRRFYILLMQWHARRIRKAAGA